MHNKLQRTEVGQRNVRGEEAGTEIGAVVNNEEEVGSDVGTEVGAAVDNQVHNNEVRANEVHNNEVHNNEVRANNAAVEVEVEVARPDVPDDSNNTWYTMDMSALGNGSMSGSMSGGRSGDKDAIVSSHFATTHACMQLSITLPPSLLNSRSSPSASSASWLRTGSRSRATWPTSGQAAETVTCRLMS